MNKFATVLTVLLLMLPVALHAAETAKAGAELPCSVTASGTRATLQSPAFTFTLDTAEGLRAVSWENKLTGRKLSLGNGPEVELDIGLPGQPLTTPKLRVVKAPAASTSASGEAVFELAADDPKLSATVAYRWEAEQPVLRKSVTIANRGGQEWNRLLNVRLGVYLSAARPSGAKWVGFPVYLDDAFFLSLAHPSGRTVAEKGEVQLLQYPGAKLDPGKVFDCMEVVYGVAADGQARQGFIAHLKSRMRRVVR
ncbi:MAG: hypothetical protein MUE50_14170, partial [Pirellulaceae bacterium]|nr:hypothetical protein [Pirellulaceae bacterium]